MSTPEERIRARVAADGRISVAEFMAEALYGEGGYYRQAADPIGPRGDFYASARVHPAFAALLAVQIAQVWEAWGRPDRFDVCEIGGGHGTLATDLAHALADIAPALGLTTRLQVVDWAVNADAKGAHVDMGTGEPFERVSPERGLPGHLKGVVLANEFLDALPIHRIYKRDGQVHELYVVEEGGRWVERPFPVASLELVPLLPAFEVALPEGTIAEVQPDLFVWMAGIASCLDRGIVLLIDYADEREALWQRPMGTLRGFRRHKWVADPFDEPGKTDMTCHVDLASVREAARQAGLAILGEASQAEFLINLGMAQIQEALVVAPLEPQARQANLAALADLVSPLGLGGFRVVVLGQGVDDLEPVGLKGGGEPASAPVLTRRHMSLW